MPDPDQTHDRTGGHLPNCLPEWPGGGLTADEQAVLARGVAGGYAMVGVSARTWSVDPATGVPVGPVPEAEHRLVRDLIAREWLDGSEPKWLRCADGGDEIVAAVVPFDDAADDNAADDAGDAWFSEGYDAAHRDYLDGLGHNDEGPATAADSGALDGAPDGAEDAVGVERSVPDDGIDWSAVPMPPEMLDGIEERRTCLAQPDDPAELTTRLADLRAPIAVRDGMPSGLPAGGWRTVGAETAARDLASRGAGLGVDLDTARSMVADYLRETSALAGVPAQEWGLDQADIDAVATAHGLPAQLSPGTEAGELRATYDPAAGDEADDCHEAGWSR